MFTKSHLSLKDIGDYELILFIASGLSFFWVNGIIQSFLPLYHNNSRFFRKDKTHEKYRSPEIFNAFILLTGISTLLCIILWLLSSQIRVFATVQELPYFNLMLLYILTSTPTNLVENIYLVRNKPEKIFTYGFSTFSLQLFLVLYPIHLGYGVREAMYGLIIISVIRLIWLAILLRRYARFKFSPAFLWEHVRLGAPLIVSSLLSGSAQYIDGLIVSARFTPEKFAIFRYGAKEVPLVTQMASGLNNSMLTEFGTPEKNRKAIAELRGKSRHLMHIIFPICILLLFFANRIFPTLFTENFNRSSDIFMMYVLLVTSRALFPQTILIGLKKTRVVMIVSIVSIALNIALSLMLIPHYGLIGVALATVLIFILEKGTLIAYNHFWMGISPKSYTALAWYLFYTITLITIFILIDHRVIMTRG